MRRKKIDVVVFDCDSTLSSIEGIDELPETPEVKAQVAELTNAAMDGSLDLKDVYHERLKQIAPNRGKIFALKELYKETTLDYAREVIAVLQAANIEVAIVSGGLYDPVREYGIWLGIKEENIFAVKTEYDSVINMAAGASSFQDPYFGVNQLDPHNADLTQTNGKANIVRNQFPGKNVLLVGDGSSDLATKDNVSLFVGFTGVVERPKVVSEASVSVKELPALLPLVFGKSACIGLGEFLASGHSADSSFPAVGENLLASKGAFPVAEPFSSRGICALGGKISSNLEKLEMSALKPGSGYVKEFGSVLRQAAALYGSDEGKVVVKNPDLVSQFLGESSILAQ